jgi:MFS family permease
MEDRQNQKTLRTLGQTILLISLPFGILHFALPIFGVEIGANAIQIGLFFSVFSLMTVLLRPVVGWGVDYFGRRPFLIAGLVGYVVTMFAFAYIEQVWGIILARTLQGIAASFLWLAARAMTADVAGEDERGRSFGKLDQSANQGAIIGTFIGFTVLMSLNDWNLLFIGYALVGVSAVILAWWRVPETQPSRVNKSEQSPIRWTSPWILLLLVTAVTGASWAMVSPVIMIFLQKRLDVGIAELAWAYLPAALVWALLPSRLGRLADRYGRKPLMVLGLVVAAGSSFLIPGLTSLVALAGLWALQALCYAAGDPAEQALVADLTGGDQRGRAYGLYTLAAGLGATIGPLIGGWLYEVVGPQAPFYANGIILAVCALVLWAWLQVPANRHTATS